MASNASESAQLDACNKQVEDLKKELDKQNTLCELYRNEILTDSEFLGFAIEIFDKIQASINSEVINTMPVEEQRQLQETLVYVKERQAADNLYRKEGDPAPRTYEEYRNP